MKNQNRVRREVGSKTARAQARSQSTTQVREPAAVPAGPAVPELIWPARVAEGMEAAMFELNWAADAATALALMNAHIIKHSARDFGEWEEFSLPRFSAGAEALARMMVTRLTSCIESWSGCMRRLAAEAREHREAVRALPDTAATQLAELQVEGVAEAAACERAVGALDHCIEAQGWVLMTCGGSEVAGHCEFHVMERLRAADVAAGEVFRELRAAVLAARAAQAGAEESRVAA